MISLKLVVPLGCLAVISAALPWPYEDDPAYDVLARTIVASNPLCLDLVRESATERRPGLLPTCICKTARAHGCDYANNYYKQLGVQENILASALDRCPPINPLIYDMSLDKNSVPYVGGGDGKVGKEEIGNDSKPGSDHSSSSKGGQDSGEYATTRSLSPDVDGNDDEGEE